MDKKIIEIQDIEYSILENKNDCFNLEEVREKYTDYFEPYDYVLGDYAYGKLRLKGFCDKNNKIFNNINDIKSKDTYLKKQCAYHCNYFLLKKEKNRV